MSANSLRFWTAVRDYAAGKVRSSYMERYGHERRCPNCRRWTSETMGSGPTREDGDHQWMVCQGCGHESRWLMIYMLPVLDEPDRFVPERHRTHWQTKCQATATLLAEARSERDALAQELGRTCGALKLLLPFVDFAAGEGLMFTPTPDENGHPPQMDAADLTVAAANALGFVLGDPDYMALLSSGHAAIKALNPEAGDGD